MLDLFRLRRRDGLYRIPWDKLDISDPARPRLLCPMTELPAMKNAPDLKRVPEAVQGYIHALEARVAGDAKHIDELNQRVGQLEEQVRLLQAENQALPQLNATALYRWNGLTGEMPNEQHLSTRPGQFTDW